MNSIPMYQRNKSVRSWLSDSHLAIEAHFDDPVHSILLTLQISREDKTVTDIQAQFIRCPFPDMCPKSIEATSKAVIGLGIGPGFNKALRERLPATSGCVHISALLR
ncbi:MAG: DUF2889 domain-containing protein, partial [Spirochaetaceae bacterium]